MILSVNKDMLAFIMVSYFRELYHSRYFLKMKSCDVNHLVYTKCLQQQNQVFDYAC